MDRRPGSLYFTPVQSPIYGGIVRPAVDLRAEERWACEAGYLTLTSPNSYSVNQDVSKYLPRNEERYFINPTLHYSV